MESEIVYFVKSAFSLAVFYVVYKVFLSRETYFKLNRLYLLATMVLSFVMPLLHLPVAPLEQPHSMYYVLKTVTVTNNQFLQSNTHPTSFMNVLKLIWLSGVFFFTFRFFLRLFQLLKLTRRFSIKKINGLNIAYTDENFTPFSFFNSIFLNTDLDQNDIEKVVSHEQIHIRQYHSVDILLAELFFIFQWFNPVVLLYKKSLIETHEFLADDAVISDGMEKISYQQLILSMGFNSNISVLTNNFNSSQIKRRIIMMSKMKSGLKAKFKFFLIVPLIVCFTGFLACNRTEKATQRIQSEENLTDSEIVVDNEYDGGEVFESVDEQPEFGDTPDALGKFFRENIVYPQEAREKGLQGKVFITFLITKNGKVANAEILRSDNEIFNEEALRVVRSMPDWKPGKVNGENVNVKFVIPIQFALN